MIRPLLKIHQKNILKSLNTSIKISQLVTKNKFPTYNLAAINGIRFASTQIDVKDNENGLKEIVPESIVEPKVVETTVVPETTVIPEPTTVEAVTATFSEPTAVQSIEPTALSTIGDYASFGLCNYTPVGGIEKILEFFDLGLHMPWLASIGITTIVIRTLLLPLIINLNKSATKMANVKPEMDAITAKINRAKKDQDHYELALQSQNLRTLFKKHDLKPFRMMLIPVVQAPVMISFFLALRALADVPIPSLLDGGYLWFTNLAVADPYYILPTISSLGFLAVFEMGSELGAASQQQPKWMKTFMRVVSLGMIPVTCTMPAVVFLYWIPSSLFSMVQIYALNNSRVRKMLKMPELIKQLKRPEIKKKKGKSGWL
ncbi:hypothetical protein K502DRAFT_343875 [Neoconidiobolus thromboides FSU 785]|nr:hypothetical protein K502DRAFT_343875 [Neoconidiobolus thromboides FSU 785]